jgi:type I restriction enzyme S subunit
MKDSGIEWLGEIPAHWEVSSIKFHAKIQNGSTPSSSNEEFWNGDVNWVTTDDLGKLEDKNIYKTRRTITKLGYESCGTTLAPIDSIVISTRAPIGHIGILKIEASTNQGCKTIIPISINPLFCFYYFLNSKEILQSMGQGSTFKELPTSSLKDFKIVFPKSIEEQQEISKFLEFKNDEIDKIKSKSNQEIELLKEYKTALISDVVTGKLDVRNEKLN